MSCPGLVAGVKPKHGMPWSPGSGRSGPGRRPWLVQGFADASANVGALAGDGREHAAGVAVEALIARVADLLDDPADDALKLTKALVVISPSSMTKPVLVATSQATPLMGSCSKQKSGTEIGDLGAASGCPKLKLGGEKQLGTHESGCHYFCLSKIAKLPFLAKGQFRESARLSYSSSRFSADLAPSTVAVVVEVSQGRSSTSG